MGYLNFWPFFAKFIKTLLLPKELFPHTFDPKIPFQVVWSAPNPNFALQIARNQKQFWGIFWWGWKTFRGSSIPENLGKIQQEMGEKLGAQFWGFKLLMTPALSSTGKTLKTADEKMPYQTHSFSSYSSSRWVNQWDLWPLQAPKPLWVEGAYFIQT